MFSLAEEVDAVGEFARCTWVGAAGSSKKFRQVHQPACAWQQHYALAFHNATMSPASSMKFRNCVHLILDCRLLRIKQIILTLI